MAEIGLSTCLKQHATLVGHECTHLGKRRGSFFFGRKILLAHTKEGWKILKLNVFQLFWRRLGGYKSTHLKKITKKLNKLEMRGDIKSCHTRIQACWSKKYVIGLGNSNLSEAKVICFAENHLDKCFRASTAQLINAYYQEGDIVLVEGWQAGKELESKLHQQTEQLKSGCRVYGWEPENFKELNGACFKRAADHSEKLLTCYTSLKEIVPIGRQFTEEDFSLIKIEVDKLILKIKELNLYYQSKSHFVLNADKIIVRFYDKLKNKSVVADDPGALLLTIVVTILAELAKNEEKSLYKNMTPQDVRQVLKSASQRNDSLAKEIDQRLTELCKSDKKGRKIFVIAGKSHLLRFPLPYKDCQQVQDVLQRHQFIVVTSKEKSIPKQDFPRVDLGLKTRRSRS